MINYEFRSDDIEKEQIRKRNISIAKEILEKSGITQDNPQYRDFLVQTSINVHNTFRFSIYGDDAYEELMTLVKNAKTVDEYKEKSFEYKKRIVEEQISKATGSTFSREKVISYEGLERTIKETILSGMEMRKEFDTKFPDIFYDENDTIRERLVIEIPVEKRGSSAMGMIANYACLHEGVFFNRVENRFEVDGKPIGPEKFFKNKKEKLERFVKQVDENESVLDLDDKELMDIVLNGTYSQFVELRAKRGKEGDKKNLPLRNALSDRQVFEDMQARLALYQEGNVESFMHYTREVMFDYEDKANLVRREVEKDTIENIDRIIFSVNPYDVATQSTYRDWNSCMHAVGCNHRYVDDSIGVGSIVAYGFDSSNPSKMVSRLLIHPFKNENGEVAYSINPRIYGCENVGFRDVVSDVVSREFNKGKDGVFYYNLGLGNGEKGFLYNDGGSNYITCFAVNERGELDLKKRSGTSSFYLGNTDLSSVVKFILPKNANIAGGMIKDGAEVEYEGELRLRDFAIGKEVKFNGNDDYSIFIIGLKQLGRDVKFPNTVCITGDIADGIDLSGIDNLVISGNITFGKDIKLPKNVKILEDVVIGENIPQGLDISQVKKITLNNISSIDEGTKLPDEVTISGMVPTGLDLENCNNVLIKNISQIGEGVNLPKKLTIEGFVDNIDLSGIEELTLKDPEIGENVLLPKDVIVTGKIGAHSKLQRIENATFNGEIMCVGGMTKECMPKNIKYADNVILGGVLYDWIDIGNRENLEIKNLDAIVGQLSFPKKVKVDGTSGVTYTGDFSSAESLDITSGNLSSDAVILPSKVKANKTTFTECDFRFVEELEVGQRCSFNNIDKLSKKLKVIGKFPIGIDYSKLEELSVVTDEFSTNSGGLPEVVNIKCNSLSYTDFKGVKKLTIDGCERFNRDFSDVDEVELSNENKVYKFEHMMYLPKKLKIEDGCEITGYLQTSNVSSYVTDISEIKDLKLVDCMVAGNIILPENISVSGDIRGDSNYDSCKSINLFGKCNLGIGFKYGSKVKIEDGCILSGDIPDGMDLSDAKGLVLSGNVIIGEDVKLPKDVKFEDGIKVGGKIPENTDLSDVKGLQIKNNTEFGENVKIPDDTKFMPGYNDHKCTIKGYIPHNVDLREVGLHNAIISTDIPDGVDIGTGAVLSGDIRIGKNVKISYDTDLSQANFIGDCIVSEESYWKGADFSKADSLTLNFAAEIDKTVVFPKNGNVKFNDMLLVKDDESLSKISEYNVEDLVVVADFDVNKGDVFDKNLCIVWAGKNEEACMVVLEGKENFENEVNKVHTFGIPVEKIRVLSHKEATEMFGIVFRDTKEDKESRIEGIKSRLAKKGVTTSSAKAKVNKTEEKKDANMNIDKGIDR